jgi:hypothetical protein
MEGMCPTFKRSNQSKTERLRNVEEVSNCADIIDPTLSDQRILDDGVGAEFANSNLAEPISS